MIEEQNIGEAVEGGEIVKRPVGRPRIHPRDGEEESPQWADRVQRNGVGRQKKGDWDNSVLKYIKGYTAKMGWSTQLACKHTVNAMRLMADRYEQVRKVIECWDAYPTKRQGRIFSLDWACDDSGVDRDEFAGLVLAAVSKHIQRNSIAIIDQSFERIIQAAVDHAISGGPKGAQERIELIKLLTREERKPKVAAKAETPSQGELPAEGRQAQSLDSQLAELDDIESIGVG